MIRADLLEVSRMYKGWSQTSFDPMFKLNTGVATRGHSAKTQRSVVDWTGGVTFLSNELSIDGTVWTSKLIIDSATCNCVARSSIANTSGSGLLIGLCSLLNLDATRYR